MAQSTTPADAIAADPVIVDVSDALSSATISPQAPVADESSTKEDEKPKGKLSGPKDGRREPSRGRRQRSFSPVRYRYPSYPPPLPRQFQDNRLLNSQSLEDFLEGDDIHVETGSSRMHPAYITTYSLHPADVEKYSWLFEAGALDAWVQRTPSYSKTSREPQYEFPVSPNRRYRDGEDFDAMPIVNLGGSLRTFKENDPNTAKVKFVVVIENKDSSRWAKMVICHSRQAAMCTIVHQVSCNHAVTFVGAVLQDACLTDYSRNRTVKCVECFEELETTKLNEVRIIC